MSIPDIPYESLSQALGIVLLAIGVYSVLCAFGVFKPQWNAFASKGKAGGLGALLIAIAGGFLVMSLREVPVPQKVKWGPNDNLPPGISVEGGKFVPWNDLKPEVERNLLWKVWLPERRDLPAGSHLECEEHENKPCWIVRIVDSRNQELGHVWFGVNPDDGWTDDGLVRVGRGLHDAVGSDRGLPYVWQTYQRWSTGVYRRVPDTRRLG